MDLILKILSLDFVIICIDIDIKLTKDTFKEWVEKFNIEV